jgi:hypothetical protein
MLGRHMRGAAVRGAALVLLLTGVATIVVAAPSFAAHRASAVAHMAACPIAGQCGLNPKTHCPTRGPLQPRPPERCVKLQARLFWVTHPGASGGCVEELIVQAKIPPGYHQYEAVVYSTIGLGTRWWSKPVVASTGDGPGAGPGRRITAYGTVSYTVPAGHYAWQVGGGAGGSCSTGKDWVGDGAWGVRGGSSTGGSGGSGGGGGGGSVIHVDGPTKNKLGASFAETVRGSAQGAANYVISGEQLNPAGGCAPTYAAESRRGDWTQWPTGTGPVHGSFSLVARFGARSAGTHGICAYLINRASRLTIAHAGLFWTNS